MSASALTTTKPVPLCTAGTDAHFIEYFFERQGELIELRAVAVEYDAFSGRYLREEIGLDLVEEEYAEDASSDMQSAGNAFLDNLGHTGFSSPVTFTRAVTRALQSDVEAARAYLDHARAVNSLMFAAAE